MCPSLKILNQTKNGVFTYCSHSHLFQFVFNNLCFELYEWELEKFIASLNELDVSYWEEKLNCSIHQRKIPIRVENNHFIILVNRSELFELKNLLDKKPVYTYLNVNEIDYTFTAN